MIPVSFTCEADRRRPAGQEGPERFDPVVRLNGEVLWRGAPVDDSHEAEQVALGYLRYALGGLLLSHGQPLTAQAPPAAGPAQVAAPGAPLAASLDQVVEGLRREIADGVQRLQDFIDGGDWKRFLP